MNPLPIRSRPSWIAMLAAVWAGAALADSPSFGTAEVPPKPQAAMVLRILPYDRNLVARAGVTVTIAVLAKADDADSLAAQQAMVAALEASAARQKVAGLPAKVVALPYTTRAKLTEDLRSHSADAVYVCRGLEGSLSAIVEVTRAFGALTFAAQESYVRAGVSVGVVLRGTKAALLVNLAASRAEKADLDSAFLELVDLVP